MDSFTKREIDVIFQLLLGLNNKDISKKLCISNHTTKAHLASIFRKLNVANRFQATIKCFSLYINHKISKEDLEKLLQDYIQGDS